MKHVTVDPHLLLANALYSRVGHFGGTTLNHKFESPHSGYIVSVVDGLIFNSLSEVNEHTLSQWIKDNSKFLKDNKFYFGSWKDKETGKVYFDIVVCFNSLFIAEMFAISNKQIVIYDLNNNKDITIR